jgi:hypothetical protein
MPILSDNDRVETDRCYTPMEHRRREEMHLVRMKYGFFRVAKERVHALQCARCHRDIDGQALRINGITYHYDPRTCEQ